LHRLLTAALLLVLWVGAQTQTALPPQVALGQKVYLAHCAACHGQKGEGGSAHPLVGPGKLRGYQNAFNLYNYTKLTMPFDRPQPSKTRSTGRWWPTCYTPTTFCPKASS